jgi:hypothetical protein
MLRRRPLISEPEHAFLKLLVPFDEVANVFERFPKPETPDVVLRSKPIDKLRGSTARSRSQAME